MAETAFFKLPEDVLLSIFFKLEDDPRNWARLACVSTKFLSIVRAICYKSKCTATIPSVVADLTAPDSESPPGGWAPLFKLAVCCPGIHHAGVLLDNSDFGLQRELGTEDSFPTSAASGASSSSHGGEIKVENSNAVSAAAGSECYWSLYDDLYFDTVYDASETVDGGAAVEETVEMAVDEEPSSPAKKRKICRSKRSHLASGVWSMSREQGNKLLASRFRGDCLYLCDWPGCVHIEEKRNYMLFRGVFKNFKKSRVWRTINDGNRGKMMDLSCAFCSCNQTWDLHSAFCLRRGFGYHEDGDPVVRAYVCENGHVSGAWTDLPLYI